MPDPAGPLVVTQVRYDHPDGVALTARVQAYYEKIYGGPDTSHVDDHDFAPPRGAFFVGYAAGRPVVMGGWRWHPPVIDLPADRPAEIKRMYVVEDARGRGLARLLLQHLEQSARQAGADALVLETGQPQADAIGLYRSSGYADIPRFGHYAAEPDAVHLGKLL
ncbi:MAG: GNAT family N-acetyltransferase [Propionibacteriales bacterium]|nr:GNAT family N-acetyltransferase [Propionibacteriales bacterium]